MGHEFTLTLNDASQTLVIGEAHTNQETASAPAEQAAAAAETTAAEAENHQEVETHAN